MEIIILFFWLFLIICFLVGNLSYEYGKKERWNEISREYIVLHKSVLIKPTKPLDKNNKKTLTKKH